MRPRDRTELGRIRKSANAREMEIDAGIVAAGLGIDPVQLQALMQAGKISVLCERGVGEDQGRHRVTYYQGERRFRVLIDRSGRIFQDE